MTALRDASSRVVLPNAVSPNTQAFNNWIMQIAKVPITQIQAVWANWAVSGVETPTGGVMTYTAAVEFPIGGTITRLTWNGGATSIAVPDGQEGVTDLVTLPTTIPAMSGTPNLTFNAAAKTITRDSGSWIADGFAVGHTVAGEGTVSNNAAFGPITGLTATVMTVTTGVVNEGPVAGAAVGGLYRLRNWQQNTVGACYQSNSLWPNASVAGYGDTGQQSSTDYTMSAALGVSANTNMWPARIMTMTATDNSVCLVEDSRGTGAGEDPSSAEYNRGQCARPLSPRHAMFRLGQAGIRAENIVASHTRQLRLAALSQPKKVAIVLGINDIGGSRTAVAIEADIVTIASYFPTAAVYIGTIAPYTTSTDSWATTANQTVQATEAVRVAVNTWIRALTTATIANFAGVLEIADAQESARNSGKWKANGSTGQLAYTVDGLHASETGDKAVSITIP